MRSRRRILRTLAILALLPVFSPSLVAQAPQAFGVSPPSIDVVDAQTGQRYVRTVVVQNQLDTASTITVEREGLTGSWTTADPPTGFQMPPRSNRNVNLSIDVPAGAAGPNTGTVRFTTEEKGSPSGSGAGLRYAVAVRLNVTVQGTARVQINWGDVRAADVDAGTHPNASLLVINDGNVRHTVRARGEVLAFTTPQVLANATGTIALDPGARGDMSLTADRALPIGQYRFRVVSTDPAGFDGMDGFKVRPPGTLAPDGLLRALVHEPRVDAGTPVRIDAWFENHGNVTIQRAMLRGEVRLGERLVATLASEELVVTPGSRTNLSAYWTPDKAGVYAIEGHVNYDGYVTPDAQSVLNVRREAETGALFFLIVAVLGMVALAVAIAFWLRNRRR